MKKKLSQKDKKDWENFITNNKKLENKDKIDFNLTPSYIVKSIDLHGYTLEEANHKVSDFINNCFFQAYFFRQSKRIQHSVVMSAKGCFFVWRDI